jgi:GT2 family glycosyltransferase
MVAVAEKDSQVGAVASVILDGNEPAKLDSCGVGIALDGMSRQAMRGEPHRALEESFEVLMPSGCACLFRADALESVGLFDEAFFAYCEDADLGLRLRWAGLKAVVAPGAEVTHFYSMTTGKYALDKIFWVERNHFWVAIKNYPVPLLALVPFVTLWRCLVQAYTILRRSGDLRGFTEGAGMRRVVATIIKAWLSALAGAVPMFAKRMKLLRKRKIGIFEMFRLMRSFRMSVYEVVAGKSNAGE